MDYESFKEKFVEDLKDRLDEQETMPVFVRDYDNDEATIIMVDSNLQREEILPSEKAKAGKPFKDKSGFLICRMTCYHMSMMEKLG